MTRIIKDKFEHGPMAMIYRVNAGKTPTDSWIQDPEVGGGAGCAGGFGVDEWVTSAKRQSPTVNTARTREQGRLSSEPPPQPAARAMSKTQARSQTNRVEGIEQILLSKMG